MTSVFFSGWLLRRLGKEALPGFPCSVGIRTLGVNFSGAVKIDASPVSRKATVSSAKQKQPQGMLFQESVCGLSSENGLFDICS